MSNFLLAFLCSACIGHTQAIDETPLRSLAELLLVQHPVGARGNLMISASRQGKTGVIGRGQKDAAMNFEGMPQPPRPPQGMPMPPRPPQFPPTPPQPPPAPPRPYAAVETIGGLPKAPKFDVKQLAGISAPLGFFDPLGFTEDASEGKIRFYREVELKHGRVGMLAALGFLVAEQFHPLFGGKIDVPSYIAFQETPLQAFWGSVLFAIALLEVFSVFTFNSPFGGELWSIRSDYEPGNLGFDPLNLKPTDPKELKEMQTKELNNGRLAMLAAAGMIAQELATGQKLF